MKPYIQPFERHLAVAELEAISGSDATPVQEQRSFLQEDEPKLPILFDIRSRVPADYMANRLAYWECLTAEGQHVTAQSLREATVNVVRNGVPPGAIRELVQNARALLPNRRCLRYGTHGLHEYRGKFFPQLVRSLLNIARLPTRATVGDPMCGSGTTLVEVVLSGHFAVGLDMNPLSVFMAGTKSAALSVAPSELERHYASVREALMSWQARRENIRLRYFHSLPLADQQYLRSWFSEQVLTDLDQIMQAILRVGSQTVRNVMLLALSNILRAVSWQKEDDLRVRKEVRLDSEVDPIREFLEEIGRSVRLLLAFLYQIEGFELGGYSIACGDARALGKSWRTWKGQMHAMVTSPPYATALPYLDTDRLSLCYLGLLQRPLHRHRDLEMIGNREITDRIRRMYWENFEKKKSELPRSIVSLIATVVRRNNSIEVGFRRRNLPALLTKYFLDMKEVFESMATCLVRRGVAFVVVGSNHTVAGGTRTHIDTPTLLADLSLRCGLELIERIPMEMLVSRDIFRKNAGDSEQILFLRRTD